MFILNESQVTGCDQAQQQCYLHLNLCVRRCPGQAGGEDSLQDGQEQAGRAPM